MVCGHRIRLRRGVNVLHHPWYRGGSEATKVKTIVIRSHLGLGDALIINAIVRDRAATYDKVILPTKGRNQPSVSFMFRDLDNVKIEAVANDAFADMATDYH